jgi:phage terminase large subunit
MRSMRKELKLPSNFEPRRYQVAIMAAFDSGIKRGVWVAHRRSGKEKTCLNIVAKKMWERVGAYYYVFPELAQGRKIIWDGADREGFRFIDHFPAELLEGKPNDTEMKLRYKNGSLFQIVGSDRFNSVMGTNPIGMVLSEYSLQDPACWGYFRPILAENDGWAIFNFTPRGENHAYDIYELAKADPKNWFCQLLTVEDTGAIKPEVLEQEKREIIRLYGNDALYRQEYFCDFSVPISGAYYAELISKAYRDGRVGHVPHETRLTVDTWWDLGINDKMSVWFTQSVGQEIRVIDYLEGSEQGLPFYIGKLAEKGYIYGRHTAPHDIEVRELTNGKSRRDTARGLGINFNVAPKLPIHEGIDAVRGVFGRLWFDADKCRDGLNALKNYRKQYDEKRKTYLNQPYHDWSSNGADAFRTLATGLDMDYKNLTAGSPDKYMQSKHKRESGSLVGVLG